MPQRPLALERVNAALAGRTAQAELVEVHDQEQAAARGMNGSPTFLLDGVGRFVQAGAVPSVSCRLYREADGTVDDVPCVAALREAGSAPHQRGLRAVHLAVLRHFADIGTAPGSDALKPVAAQAGHTTWEWASKARSKARDVSMRWGGLRLPRLQRRKEFVRHERSAEVQ